MDQNKTGSGPLELDVVRCMDELLRPVPDLAQRYSPRAIVLAFLTHASAGIRELRARGEFSLEEAERLSEDFRSRVTAADVGPPRTRNTTSC